MNLVKIKSSLVLSVALITTSVAAQAQSSGISEAKAATQISSVMDQMGMADSCDSFVAEDNIEKWGDEILSTMSPSATPNLYKGAEDLTVQCPNFGNLTMKEKEYVWVLILTAMANAESTCRTSKPNRGAPYGIAVGLFQFHDWGPKNDPQCPRASMKNAGASIDCALEMLDDQLLRSNRLFSAKSYWGVLRTKGDLVKTKKGSKRVYPYLKIAKAINRLQMCKLPGAK